MKLIAEHEIGNVSLIKEELDENGVKSLFIEGIFAQAELKNRNKRIYPKKILESAIDEYIKTHTNKKQKTVEVLQEMTV